VHQPQPTVLGIGFHRRWSTRFEQDFPYFTLFAEIKSAPLKQVLYEKALRALFARNIANAL
jgi:hypothetical protein